MAKYSCGAAAIRLLWSFWLAADHRQEVAGVLAFSSRRVPRRSACGCVTPAAKSLCSYLCDFGKRSGTRVAAAKSILAVLRPRSKRYSLFPHIAGVHGSSTLREDRNRAGESENWRAVEEFLNSFKPKERKKTDGSPLATPCIIKVCAGLVTVAFPETALVSLYVANATKSAITLLPCSTSVKTAPMIPGFDLGSEPVLIVFFRKRTARRVGWPCPT